jgi:uncharacterized metal-binding protein
MKCASCGHKDCYGGKDCKGIRERTEGLYADPEIRKITAEATALESRGYMQLTRLEEVAEFAGAMGYTHLGLAFCLGLSEEAKDIAKYFGKRFRVSSACCKCGGIEKEALGLTKLRPERTEAMCNPVAQALLLNEAGTHLNLIAGLCVGHDILFTRHSEAPVSTLVVKDRVLGHAPLAAVYSRYYRKKLGIAE